MLALSVCNTHNGDKVAQYPASRLCVPSTYITIRICWPFRLPFTGRNPFVKMRQNWPSWKPKKQQGELTQPVKRIVVHIIYFTLTESAKQPGAFVFHHHRLNVFCVLFFFFLLLLLAASRSDIVMNDRIDETAKAIKRDRAIAQTLTPSLSGNRVPVCWIRNTMLLFERGGFVRMMIKLELRKTTFSLPTVPSQKTHK